MSPNRPAWWLFSNRCTEPRHLRIAVSPQDRLSPCETHRMASLPRWVSRPPSLGELLWTQPLNPSYDLWPAHPRPGSGLAFEHLLEQILRPPQALLRED